MKRRNQSVSGFLFIISLPLFLFHQPLCAGQADIIFAFVGDTEQSAYAGVKQGLAEANLQGQFLGKKYAVKSFTNATELAKKPAPYLAIIAAVPAAELLVLHDNARHIPVFNLLADNDSLRNACLGNILSIIPSRKMKQDAIAQWQRVHAGARVSATAWHKDFVKFAARDLNKRFRKAFKTDMDEYAWAGWAAVRMTADSVVRGAINGPVSLLHHLKTSLSFDGQKGRDLDFRETGQLRQPLLIVEDGRLAGEAPVRGVSQDIDSLGIRECSK